MNNYKDQWKPILEHDSRATEEFIKVCLRKIYIYLKNNGCTDHHKVEDMFYEAFRIMWENVAKGKCEFKSSPCTYLLGIVKNLWRGGGDGSKKRPNPEGPGPTYDPFKDDEEEEMGKNSPQEDAMRKAFTQLSGACRELLTLKYFEEKSYAEIAKIRDTTLTYVKTSLARCRDKLKDLM